MIDRNLKPPKLGWLFTRPVPVAGLLTCLILTLCVVAPVAVSSASGMQYWTFRSHPIAVAHGWKAYLIVGHAPGYPGSVEVAFANGPRVVSFAVQTATVAGKGDRTETMNGALGRFGSIHMTFSSPDREHKICRTAIGRDGEVRGTLRFSDGKSFKLDASALAGTISDYATESMTSLCSRTGPSNTPELTLQVSGYGDGANRNFAAMRFPGGRLELQGQLVATLPRGMTETSTVDEVAAGAQLSASSDLGSATVSGSGLFSGSATFHAAHTYSHTAASGTMSGTLTTTFAGMGKRIVVANDDQGSLNS